MKEGRKEGRKEGSNYFFKHRRCEILIGWNINHAGPRQGWERHPFGEWSKAE